MSWATSKGRILRSNAGWQRLPKACDKARPSWLGRRWIVIVAFGTSAASAALSTTSILPVVYISGDPVGAGLATNLAHPGGNATGVSTLSTQLMPKRLQLLQQVAPRMRRVILLGNPSSTLHAGQLEELRN